MNAFSNSRASVPQTGAQRLEAVEAKFEELKDVQAQLARLEQDVKLVSRIMYDIMEALLQSSATDKAFRVKQMRKILSDNNR